jgi:hypothetical protein
MGPSGSRFQHTWAWPSAPGEENSVALNSGIAHKMIVHTHTHIQTHTFPVWLKVPTMSRANGDCSITPSKLETAAVAAEAAAVAAAAVAAVAAVAAEAALLLAGEAVLAAEAAAEVSVAAVAAAAAAAAAAETAAAKAALALARLRRLRLHLAAH